MEDMNNLIRKAIKTDPFYLPKKVAMMLAKDEYFIRNVTYIDDFGYYVGTKTRPITGELGIFNGSRIITDI